MDDTKLKKDQPIPESTKIYNSLINTSLPSISLPNQTGNLLKINRIDTFRKVIYFYSMTGRPDKKLPHNWEKIPGASGCTFENCKFRDNYENFIKLNALPIGISTQNIEDLKEMTDRLGIQHDILSDIDMLLTNKLFLPTFSVENKTYLKRLTLIVEKNIVKKVFYPVTSINKHIDDILIWLKENY